MIVQFINIYQKQQVLEGSFRTHSIRGRRSTPCQCVREQNRTQALREDTYAASNIIKKQ